MLWRGKGDKKQHQKQKQKKEAKMLLGEGQNNI